LERARFIKDPSTGKRVSRRNPDEEWIRSEVPELRIVDDALWQGVKARQAELARPRRSACEMRAQNGSTWPAARSSYSPACSLAAAARANTGSS
jgi:hypothetical protein